MGGKARTVEEVAGRIADSEHGVVTRAELLAAGVSEREIERRVGKGSLLREYRGVYRVGHRAPSIEATYLAAVKACGGGARLSGTAAGHLWRLLKGQPPPPEVTAPTERRVPGVITRRCRSLEARELTRWRGVPVTTVAGTLVDLAAILEVEQLARACHEAGVLYRTTPAHVEAVLARRPKAAGAGKLREVLRGDVHVTLSKLELEFLRLLEAAALPLPRTNKAAGRRRVDCRWHEHRLTAELDSYTFHSSRHAWEQDRRREREAYARGDAFRRYTWGDVFERPRAMLHELEPLLRGPRTTV